MPIRIDVWSDFVCPYCFAASFSLKELEELHEVAIHWRSYELRPKGSPPISPEYLARIEASRPRLIQMMWEMYGVDLQPGPFGINSRPALIAAKFADAQGEKIGRRSMRCGLPCLLDRGAQHRGNRCVERYCHTSWT